MLPPLLFEIPAQFQMQVASGIYRQVGALILDPATGRIVKHLQQTGVAQDLVTQLIRSAPGALSMLSQPVGIVSAIATFSQNRAILQGITLLQNLQMGSLMLGGLDLGVGLAGHAITVAKLDRLAKAVQAIDDRLAKMEARIEDLHGQAIRNDFLQLDAVCRQVDDGWHMADPSRTWSDAASALYGLQSRFFDRASQGLAAGSQALERVDAFISAAGLAGMTLVSVRTGMGDMKAAHVAAEHASRALNAVSSRIGLREVLGGLIETGAEQSVAARVNAVEVHKAEARAATQRFRDRETQAAAAVPILDSLIARDVDGRAWLESLRSEKRSAFVLVDHGNG